MSSTKIHTHIYADDRIEVIRHSEAMMWFDLGDVTVFLDEEQLARIHAATAPVVSECGREWHSVEIQGSSLLMSQLR